jgi:hypothetical protein
MTTESSDVIRGLISTWIVGATVCGALGAMTDTKTCRTINTIPYDAPLYVVPVISVVNMAIIMSHGIVGGVVGAFVGITAPISIPLVYFGMRRSDSYSDLPDSGIFAR